MVLLTGINGTRHVIAVKAIARLTEASASSQWHGIRTIVRLFDGGVIESSDSILDIQKQMEDE